MQCLKGFGNLLDVSVAKNHYIAEVSQDLLDAFTEPATDRQVETDAVRRR